MALDADVAHPTYDAPEKDLYELGEMPPFGYVPRQMYAWAIRRERHGEPEKAFQVEIVDTPLPSGNEVLVLVMAAGVNYNGVWAGLGVPISPFDGHMAMMKNVMVEIQCTRQVSVYGDMKLQMGPLLNLPVFKLNNFCQDLVI